MAGVFVFWLLFGVISAFIALAKGRSGCGWFILGILLGPFGLLGAAIMSPNRSGEVRQEARRQDKATQKALRRGELKICPSCAEAVKKEAVKCRFCGSELPA